MGYVVTGKDTIRHGHFKSTSYLDFPIDIQTDQEVIIEDCLIESPGTCIDFRKQKGRLILNNVVGVGRPGFEAGEQQGRFVDGVSGHQPGQGVDAFEMYNCLLRGTGGVNLKAMRDGFVRVANNLCYHVDGRAFDGQGGYQDIGTATSSTRQFLMMRRCDTIDAEVRHNCVIQHTLPYYPSQVRELMGIYPDAYLSDQIIWLGKSEDIINLNCQGLPGKWILIEGNCLVGSYYPEQDTFRNSSTTGMIMDGGGSGDHCDAIDIGGDEGNTVVNMTNVGISAYSPRQQSFGGQTEGVVIRNNKIISSGVLPGRDPRWIVNPETGQMQDWDAYNKYGSVALAGLYNQFQIIQFLNNGVAWINTRQNRFKTGNYLQKILRKDLNLDPFHSEYNIGGIGGQYLLVPEGQIFYRDTELPFIMERFQDWADRNIAVGLSNGTVEAEYRKVADEPIPSNPKYRNINTNQPVSIPIKEGNPFQLTKLEPNEDYRFQDRKLCPDGATSKSPVQVVTAQ